MTNNNKALIKTFHFLSLTVLAALFFISSPLYAQNAQSGAENGAQDSGRYVIEQRYMQQLVWVGDEYTLKYEVVIERGEGKTYRAYMREFTEKPAFKVSLPPGNYRYRIISYDYLEQPGGASDWVHLEIKPVPLVPVEVQTEEDGSYIIRSSGSDKIVPGISEIVIKKPGEPENGVLVVEKQKADAPKSSAFYVSAAWSPLIPLYGGIQKVFGNELYAAGAALRLGAFYTIPDWWCVPGLEFSASWYALNKTQGADTVGTQAGAAGINIAAQKTFFNQKMAVTLRAGGAIAFQIGETNTEDEAKTIGGMAPQINVEASYLYQFWKQLYAEAGIGFTLNLNQNDNSGCLRPWLGIGWKF